MRPKIVYVTSQCPFNNKETWAIEEINSIINKNIEVIIVPRTSKGQAFQEDAKKLLKNTIISDFINFSILSILFRKIIFSPIDLFQTLIWIYKQSNSLLDIIKGLAVLPKSLYVSNILKNKGITHVHAFSTTSVAVVAYILAKELKVKWSITYHASWVINNKFKKSNFAHLNSVKFARAISEQVKNSLINFVDSSLHNKIVRIHLGVKCDVNTTTKELSEERLIIASAGWLLPHKGIDISLNAIKLLIERGFSNFQWEFYGNGDLLPELEQLTKDLQIEKFVNFKGFIDNKELQNNYSENKIDLFVSNSLARNNIHEGIPVSLMEAMAYAIPVIATDCGGTKELVDNISGILISENNPKQTADAIYSLLMNKQEYSKYSKNAHNKIVEQFSSNKTAIHLINNFN